MKLSTILIQALTMSALLSGCGGTNKSNSTVNGQNIDASNSSEQDKISVVKVNRTPVASDATVTGASDSKIALTLTAVDEDKDTVTYHVVTQPKHGKLVKFNIQNGTFVYEPEYGYVGTDSFTYSVSDGVDKSTSKTVKIKVVDKTKSDVSIPEAPSDLVAVKAKCNSVDIKWQDNSDNEDGFAIYITRYDEDGNLVEEDSWLEMVKDADETSAKIWGLKPNSKYTIEVKAKNCAGESEATTVEVQTDAVDSAPTAPSDLSVVTKSEHCVRLSWKDNADNESGYEIYQNGKLLKTISPNCSCTLIGNLDADTDYHFEVKAVNEKGSSDATAVDVTTDKSASRPKPEPKPEPKPKPKPTPNKAPTVSTDGNKVITIGDSVLIKATAKDSDGTVVKYEWKEDGKVIGNSATLNYKPTKVGEHKLIIVVTDNDDATASSAVKVVVKEKAPKPKPNQAPTANAGEDKETEVDKAVTITGSGSDSDGTIASYKWTENGTVIATKASFSYTPKTKGDHTLVLTVIDNKGATDTDSVVVKAKAKPAPKPKPDTTKPVITLKGGATITITQGNDFTDPGATATDNKDGDITSKITTSGSVDNNKVGTYTITYTVSDKAGNKATATRTVVVKEKANQAPTANAGVDKSVEVNKSITLNGSGTDSDGSIVSYEWKEGNTVLGSSATLNYTPKTVGKHTLVLTVTDNDGATGSDTVVVTATKKPNQAPTANSQSTTTDEDKAKTITLSGSDSDGDSLRYTVVSQPSHGTVSVSGNQATYTPNANYHGSDSFTFKVNDGKADSAPATVKITVNAVNDKPTANPKSVTMDEDTSKVITLSGSDSDGDTLTYRITKNPTHGSVTLSGNKATYTPAHNYNGSDSFKFVVNDDTVDSDSATVNITINDVPEPNQAPTITSVTADPTTAEKGETITFSAEATDPDNDTLTYTWDNGLGGGKTVSTNSLSVGTHTVTVTVSDGHGRGVTDSTTVEVTAKPNIAEKYKDWKSAVDILLHEVATENLSNGKTAKVFINADAPSETSNDFFSVFLHENGSNEDAARFDLNAKYPKGTKFVVLVYDQNGNVIAASDEGTFDMDHPIADVNVND